MLAITFTSIEAILQTLITFPVLNKINLLFPSHSQEITSGIQVALYRGMDKFHHSKKLTIPGDFVPHSPESSNATRTRSRLPQPFHISLYPHVHQCDFFISR